MNFQAALAQPQKTVSKKTPKKGTKVTTGKPNKVVTPTRYFGFFEHTDLKDLKKVPLKIKQETPFIPQDAGGKPQDDVPVTLEIWEIKGSKTERAPYLICKIAGQVKKDDQYNFSVERLEQDPTKLPQASKPKNGRGTEMWLSSKLEILGLDGKQRGKTDLEFVLPPLEYDETLELQLGCSIPNSAVGQAKVTWDKFESMLPQPVIMKTDGIPYGKNQIELGGNLKTVVIHCMSAFYADADHPTKAYVVDTNLQTFKNLGVSAHFIIDRNGGIVQAVDIHRVAHHAPPYNGLSIGIELLGLFDGVRDQAEERYANEQAALQKKKEKLEKDRKALEEVLAKREKEQADGVKEVTVGKKKVKIEESISRIKEVIQDTNDKIAALKLSDWALDYEKFTKDKDTSGVPLAFLYTNAQYSALGDLVEVLGKRFGYDVIMSHHRISPNRKTDPGKYFDWSKLKPYALPGSLNGDESAGGGKYTVKLV